MNLSDLPPEILASFSQPSEESPVPPGSRVVDSLQLGKDLDYKVGERQGYDRVKIEQREDPLEELSKPLDRYARQFFFPGLIHGYCRINTLLTERFRAAEGPIDGWVHRVQHPLISLPSVPNFEGTQLVRTLQSIGSENAATFWAFLESQILVDRGRRMVWKMEPRSVKLLDPYLMDQKGDPPYAVDVRILCPRTYLGSYVIRPNRSGFVSQPVVEFVRLHDPELEKLTKEILGG